VSTNGVAVSTNSSSLMYYSTNDVNDQIGYSIIDTAGVTATGVINFVVGSGNGIGGHANSVAFTNGAVSLTFAGISGYKYHVQVSTNLTDWNDALITNAPASGVFQFTASNSPLPAAYYRLMWNGN
jgi:hypothetical protein